MLAAGNAALDRLLLIREIEELFYAEATLLDERRYRAWLDLLTEDVRYWMPLVRNVALDRGDDETTRERRDAAWFDEGKETLTQRVQQLETGIHWAEEPASRVSHLITNVELLSADPDAARPRSVETRCRFLVYRNRLQDEVSLFVGKRRDRLVRGDRGWRIQRREIRLDQNVLLAKNLTTFF